MNTELTYLLEELDNWDEDKPIQVFLLMLIVSACTSNKHSCKGLKAHPNYKQFKK